MESTPSLDFQVAKAKTEDVGLGLARVSPESLERLGADPGDLLEVAGERTTVLKAMPAKGMGGTSRDIRIDGLSRNNAGVKLDEQVKVTRCSGTKLAELKLRPVGKLDLDEGDLDYLHSSLGSTPVSEGDRVRVEYFGASDQEFIVEEVNPPGPGVIVPGTELVVEGAESKPGQGASITYEDIGGLDEEVRRVRELVELPLKFPSVFSKLGMDPPRGVLLHGPPGTGKTLLAKAVANETDADFFHIGGPEIMGKYYGESEARLRDVFEEAKSSAPSIIFIDEIDAIAAKREELSGEKQVERRVVAQLLSLMDGLSDRGEVIVIGATNISDTLDPALRRPGRFDREIEIGVPDRSSRAEILTIHTRAMPLSAEVNLEDIADATHGYVGADLESLAKEAAMAALRRLFPKIDFSSRRIPYEDLGDLRITTKDFGIALKETTPSAMREVYTEIPSVTWDQVGGLEEVKGELREAIEWPLEHADLFEQANAEPPTGILLHGPPGTGKTLLAKAVATETEANFISLRLPNVLSKWVGEPETRLGEVFSKARQSAPCILFFDEIDCLARERGSEGSNQAVDRVVSQFLVELDGTQSLHSVVVIGATNRPDVIDPALLRAGRLDLQIEIPLPDMEARRQIFEVHVKGRPLESDVDLRRIAEEAEGFTGSDIEAVCKKASMLAIRRARRDGSGEVCLTQGDFDKGLQFIQNR